MYQLHVVNTAGNAVEMLEGNGANGGFLYLLNTSSASRKSVIDMTQPRVRPASNCKWTKIASLEAEVASLKEANGKLAAVTSKLEALGKAVSTVQELETGRVRTASLTQ